MDIARGVLGYGDQVALSEGHAGSLVVPQALGIKPVESQEGGQKEDKDQEASSQ